MNKDYATRRFFTTGQVAELTGLSGTHVRRLVESGVLSGHRVPKSSHRRVTRAALVALVVEHGLPVPPELAADVAAAKGGDS